MKEHLKLLCLEVVDRPTGFRGIVSSISFDMSGCVQAFVKPGVDKEGKMPDGNWFDTKRLEVKNQVPVIPAPTFEIVPGGQTLPAPGNKM